MQPYQQPLLSLQAPAAEPLSELVFRLRDGEAWRERSVNETGRWLPPLQMGIAQILSAYQGQVTSRLGFYLRFLNDDSPFPGKFYQDLLAQPQLAAQLYFLIDEVTALAQQSHLAQLVSVLKPLGCRFAIEISTNSLQNCILLQRLSVDYLKITATLIRPILEDLVARAVVAGIIRSAQVLGVETIAAGVDSQDLLVQVRHLGADYAQGAIAPLTPLTRQI
ncbi:MAG: EAL domain-containing protein [Chloroflexaceae bacterium]|nr:EAL domain-containing protein [Chloroflexaceae bacterium]